MQGAATNSESDGAIRVRGCSSDLVHGGAPAHSAEVDVLRNSLSAVMVEYHEQSKRLAEEHAKQSQEIAALTAQNRQLSQDLAVLAVERDALGSQRSDLETQNRQLSRDLAALAVERDGLGSQRSELEKRLSNIESSTAWLVTKRLRERFARYPRLRRLITKVWRALARP